MSKVAFKTLGCKVNQYDTEVIREDFLRNGFTEVDFNEIADIYIVNTCTVTSVSDAKCRKFIRQCFRKNPEGKIVVTGCYADVYPESFKDWNEKNLIIVSNQDKGQLHSLICSSETNNLMKKGCENLIRENFIQSVAKFTDRTRAFLKIQDGCDLFCSFCIIPFARGLPRSKPVQKIIEEANLIAQNGYKEIVLSGIHLGAFGNDLNLNDGLLKVVEHLLHIRNIHRIRLSSIEVQELSDGLIDFIINNPKICPHIHIPLQSGSDRILNLMNRSYSSQDYLNLTNKLKNRLPDIALTTDIIVGFPTETENDFNETLKICEEVQFSKIHIFRYSDRPGTKSYDIKSKCKSEYVKQRIKILNTLAKRTALGYRTKFIGKTVCVLVENSKNKNGTQYSCGFTERYVRVFFNSEENLFNKFVKVKITSASPDKLYGIFEGLSDFETL